MRGSALLVLCVLSATLAGCTERTGPVARGELDFPVVGSVAGVEPGPNGSLGLEGADGLLVTPSSEAGSIRVGLAPVVQTNVFQACVDACRNLTVSPGALIAESGVISLRNLSLNAIGPEGDSAVFFYDAGKETGRFLRWYEQGGKFQMNGDLQAIGNVTGTGYVGTITPLVVGEGQIVTVSTAATEATEVTVFARGSARLVNGTATITFPPPLVALIGNGTITAQVTLTSPAPSLWVAQKSKERLVVESVAGTTATFDWLVHAPRKGGEGFVV